MANGLSNLFENKLFLQYLAGAGSDIASGNPIGAGVNQVTQQAITNQNFNKLLSSMLGSAASPDNESKLTMDGTNIKFESPMAMTAAGKKPTSGGSTSNASPSSSNSSSLNPSQSLANLSASDLAGLSPEMIAQALNVQQNRANFERQSINDLINNKYKGAMIRQINDSINRANTPTTDTPFVTNVPGYGNLTLDQYKGLSSNDKGYVTSVLAARAIGEKPPTYDEYSKIGDKDKLPSTAMGAAIKQYYDENKKLPTPEIMAKWADLYRDKPDKTSSPVSWTTATNELTKRFGKLDPTGMWAVTPELQDTHRYAQKILTDLKAQGVDPLVAVNEAEDKARQMQSKNEAGYFYLIEAAEKAGNDEKVKRIKNSYYKSHGYLPRKPVIQ